ncbi:hypothetical protein [Taibaiella soli]|uniref:Lipocalin-like domain-containing protein n=1 Tax=Taibaiella soli TaxID=1649169 RepID=A0A2W2AZW2_9BACT|nr:hypothetical protein [Taibaiella soli]PZF73248.1 hypothetical protein DN068_08725 [Taibaiella soli]
MKLIRNIALTSFLTVAAFSAVTFTSCSKDDSGCAVGYEGSDCKTLSRDKFVGTYVGTEQCTTGTDNYSITIAANSDAIKLTMSNIYNNGNPVLVATCTMTGTNTFTFDNTQSGISFKGNGTLNGNQLVVAYQVNDGGTTNSCTYTGNK